MNWMFARCESLKVLNILNFDTSNVTEMMCVFSGCYFLKELKFNFVTKNVTNMRNMFYKCKSLTELDVSNFDTTCVSNFSDMFYVQEKQEYSKELILIIFLSDKYAYLKILFLVINKSQKSKRQK